MDENLTNLSTSDDDPHAPSGNPLIDEEYLKPLLKRHLDSKASILPWEDKEAYERLRIRLIRELHPKGELEYVLFDHIVADICHLRRCQYYRTAYLAASAVAAAAPAKESDKRSSKSLHIPYDISEILVPPEPKPDSDEHHEPDEEADKPTFKPVLATEALAIFSPVWGDPLEQIHRSEQQTKDSLFRYHRELQELQAERQALSAIPQAGRDISILDIEEELARRKRSERARSQLRKRSSPARR